MNPRLLCPSLLLVCLLLLALSSSTASATRTNAAPDFALIDAYVAQQMSQAHIPGLALGIIQDDQIIHLRGFGIASPDQHPVTPETSFAIGSMTKSFTALAVMQLVEAGKIDLDAPVQRYLPFFRVADPDASARITVRHLLHQTSGLPTIAGFWNAAQATGGDVLEQRVRALQTIDIAHPVGTVFEYCNANYDVLGLVVQVVSGQPYERYLQDHIFAPLRMEHTSTLPEADQQSGMATGHQDWFGLPILSHVLLADRGSVASGGIISSVTDLSQYLVAHLNNRAALEVINLSPDSMATLYQPSNVAGSQYAMGWGNGTIDGAPVLLHSGGSPSFTAHMLIMPQERWGVVVLANVNAFPLFIPLPVQQIALGVTSMLLGRTPGPSAFAGIRTQWVAKLAVALPVVWGLLTIPVVVRRWRSRYQQRRPGLRIVLPILLELGWIPALAILGPRIVGIPFWAGLRFNPDLMALLVVAAGISLVKVFARIAVAVR